MYTHTQMHVRVCILVPTLLHSWHRNDLHHHCVL